MNNENGNTEITEANDVANPVEENVMPELTDGEKRAIFDCVRESLWMAIVWNDHNFSPDDLLKKAAKIADSLGCKSIDDANELLGKIERVLEA